MPVHVQLLSCPLLGHPTYVFNICAVWERRRERSERPRASCSAPPGQNSRKHKLNGFCRSPRGISTDWWKQFLLLFPISLPLPKILYDKLRCQRVLLFVWNKIISTTRRCDASRCKRFCLSRTRSPHRLHILIWLDKRDVLFTNTCISIFLNHHIFKYNDATHNLIYMLSIDQRQHGYAITCHFICLTPNTRVTSFWTASYKAESNFSLGVIKIYIYFFGRQVTSGRYSPPAYTAGYKSRYISCTPRALDIPPSKSYPSKLMPLRRLCGWNNPACRRTNFIFADHRLQLPWLKYLAHPIFS